MTGLDARGLPVLMLVLAGVGINLVPTPVEGSAFPMAVLAIKLLDSEQQANITEREQCIVQFEGQVSVDKLPVERGVVFLWACTDIGWPLRIYPTLLYFTSTMPQNFGVTVTVPQGTLGNVTGTVTVKGKTHLDGRAMLSETKGTITIAPYFGVRLEPRTPVSVSRAGDGTSVELRIRNAGNANDSYELEISNSMDLSDRHWRVTISNNTVRNVGPGQLRTVKVHARFEPDRLRPFESLWTASVLVTSQNAKDHQQSVRGNLSLVMYVKPSFTYVVCPAVIILAAAVAAACVAVSVRDWLRDRRRKALTEEARHET